MSNSPSVPTSRRRVLILCVGFLLLAFGVFAWWQKSQNRVDTTTPAYRDGVSAFYVGLSALQVGDNDRAKKWLDQSVQVAASEPATWANRAVLKLRSGDFAGAKSDLDKARELAPDASAIAELGGALASAQGDSAQAIAEYERAVKSDGANLRARYALAQELQRAGTPAQEKRALEQIRAILAAQPQNLVASIDNLRLSAKSGDAAGLQTQIALLEKQSSGWDEAAREQLKALKAVAKNPQQAAIQAVFLANLLKALPIYRSSLSALANEGGELGRPLLRFLKWPAPDPAPSPPDTALTFTAQPLPDSAQVLAARATWISDEGKPLLALSSVKSTQIGAQSLPFGARQSVPFDWNNDFQNDLLLVGAGLRFFQRSASTWQDVTKNTQLPPAILSGKYLGAWPVDIESDGDLDIVLAPQNGATQVLQNNGDGTWKPLPLWNDAQNVRAFAWGDWDRDGDGDAALLDESGKLSLFANNRSGRFEAAKLPAEMPTLAAIASGDASNRGALDLICLTQDGQIVRVWFNDAAGDWQLAPVTPKGLPAAKFSPQNARLLLADLDNNGGIDVLGSDDAKKQTFVWLAGTTGELEAMPQPLAMAVQDAADLDGDGRLELLGIGLSGALQMKSTGAKTYHWTALRPRGAASAGDNRINSFGLGGQIEVRAGLLLQIQGIERPVVHFGLGERPAAEVARIGWPDGTLQGEFEFPADKIFLAEQRLKGSCPYLWAWNGEKMAFVKDCNWRSPLGLKINAQDTAGVIQTADWIKVDGKYLQPRNVNGRDILDLRITADLWETHYFDQVGLMAVDHPKGTQIWVDERFSIPMPPLQVLATDELHAVSARDEAGRDVSAKIAQVDADYAAIPLGKFQGVARDHWLQMDLTGAPSNAILICSGWLFPTDNSINVALGQGKNSGPQGLSIEVPDNMGGWRVAKKNLGFVAGKNKTVTLDLTGVFDGFRPKNARNIIRLRTNLEIFWDRIAWAAPAKVRPLITKIAPQVADLQYRGITIIKAANRQSPELPLGYNRIERNVPRWRDLEGFHTRFGDVKPLTQKIDDRYVLMNAGDELRLQFSAPAPPRAGWVRDWVFTSDGWTKDGNLNTTDSQTVGPLPSHARRDYPLGQKLHDDPVYRAHKDDWRIYHTRYVRPRVAGALQVLAANPKR